MATSRSPNDREVNLDTRTSSFPPSEFHYESFVHEILPRRPKVLKPAFSQPIS